MNEQGRKLLPPMAALNSFAAAARHGSFSRAALEIGLTQSAVSRQIAALEDWLQTSLFHRSGPRVALTDEGALYAEAVAPALRAIRQATARALARPLDTGISIATLPSFGMRWLAPRLGRLTQQLPELVVNVSARTDEFDFADEAFDAAVHFGAPTWPDVEHDRLFGERTLAVVAPALLARHPVLAPVDFLGLPLLAQTERHRGWAIWFAAAGVDLPARRPIPTFEHFLMLAQAAVAGAGAALIPSFMIEDELARGLLVAPIDFTVPTDDAYYLVYPRARLDNPHFRAFRDWMIAEAGGTADAT